MSLAKETDISGINNEDYHQFPGINIKFLISLPCHLCSYLSSEWIDIW
jgi:hypothetical protein